MSGTFALLLGDGTAPLLGSLQYEALALVVGLAVFIWHYWSLRMLPALTTSAVFYYTYFMYLFDRNVALARVAMFLTAAALVFMSLAARLLCCCRLFSSSSSSLDDSRRRRRHGSVSNGGRVEDQVSALSERLDILQEITVQRFDSLDAKLDRLSKLQTNSSAKTAR